MMFCHKCGNKLPEGSDFCSKCGAKVAQEPEKLTQPTPDAPGQKVTPNASALTATPNRDTSQPNHDFRQFIDAHVKATTKFTSAEDLLKNGKPMTFLWICLGVSVLFGTIVFFPFGGILTIFLGYLAAVVIGGVMKLKLCGKNHPITSEVNLDDLTDFLSENLSHLSPEFRDWGISLEPELDSIGTTRRYVRCKVKNDKVDSVIVFAELSDGNKEYAISSVRKISTGAVMLGGAATAGRAAINEFQCAYYAVPILTASMEYYLKYRNNKS